VVWCEIKGCKGYFVNDLGQVKSEARLIYCKDGRVRKIPQKILKTQVDKYGYERVSLSVNNIKTNLKVHRLVAEAFIENPENKPQVNHIDGNKLNNFKNNLEWVNNSENQTHAYFTGLSKIRSGVDSHRLQRYVDVYRDGVKVDTLCGNKDMKEKGFDFRLVSACLKGKRKSHKGCTFKERSL